MKFFVPLDENYNPVFPFRPPTQDTLYTSLSLALHPRLRKTHGNWNTFHLLRFKQKFGMIHILENDGLDLYTLCHKVNKHGEEIATRYRESITFKNTHRRHRGT